MTTASAGARGPAPGAAGGPAAAKTSGLAVASLVAGMLGLCTAGLGGIVGLILGAVALRRIGRSSGLLRGRALAITGLIFSVCTLLLWVLAAGIGGGVYLFNRCETKQHMRQYQVMETPRTLSQVEAALDRYWDDIGHCPTAEEGGLRALAKKPTYKDQQLESKWKGPYLREVPLDPWGHRLNYKPLPPAADTPYRLWSSGPDGVSGTPDDISLDSREKEGV